MKKDFYKTYKLLHYSISSVKHLVEDKINSVINKINIELQQLPEEAVSPIIERANKAMEMHQQGKVVEALQKIHSVDEAIQILIQTQQGRP